MDVLVIGATGTIGSAVVRALEPRHRVFGLTRTSTPPVDLARPESVGQAFGGRQPYDAVVCCAASAPLAFLDGMEPDALLAAIRGKLLGQIELTRLAASALADGGSITLTGGTFDAVAPGTAVGAMVNAGLERFVETAACELPRGIRLNAVSPGWVSETLQALGRDPSAGTSVDRVARAYVEAVEGRATGRVFRPAAS